MKKTMTIAVLGATGMVGSRTVREAADRADTGCSPSPGSPSATTRP